MKTSATNGTKLLYASPAFRTAARIVPLDVGEPTYRRGPGAVTGAFALECAIDELAEQLQIDPIELRFAQRTRPRPQLRHPVLDPPVEGLASREPPSMVTVPAAISN